MSPTFTALIWWLIPLAAVIGALGYVLWVTKFQARFQNETTRSVSQFQRFQSSFRSDPPSGDTSDQHSPEHTTPVRKAQAKESSKPNE